MKAILKELNREIRRKFHVGVVRSPERPSIEFIKNKFGDKALVGLEIGTFEGENAKHILKDLNIKKLYLIDPWASYQEYKSYSFGSGQKENLSKAYKKTLKRIKKYRDKVVLLKKFSSDALEDIKEYLDFVYIDGNHNYEFVKKDMEDYYKKLGREGILAGHDISKAGVTRAFCEFVVKTKNKSPHIGHRDWWIEKQ